MELTKPTLDHRSFLEVRFINLTRFIELIALDARIPLLYLELLLLLLLLPGWRVPCRTHDVSWTTQNEATR